MRTEEEIRTELRVMMIAKEDSEWRSEHTDVNILSSEAYKGIANHFQTKAEILKWVLNDKGEK